MTIGAVHRSPEKIVKATAIWWGQRESTTERGQDKSRQGAARSGCCFSWIFSLFRQGAPDPRNVRIDIKLLQSLSFPHIAEADDGA